MDYIEILQEMLRYIDTHIKEELNVEKLAAMAGFSSYHFCRIFQWDVGYSLMEYVRNRRLAFAAAELNSGRKIIDIAVDYGFETHSGFTKAFRRYFGSSPEKYRMNASFNVPTLPILEKTKQYINGGIIMEPKMVKKTDVKVAGFVCKTTTNNGENKKAIPEFWQNYISSGKMKKLHGEPFIKNHSEYGVCIMANPETGDMEYVIGIEVKDGADIPSGYHICTIPEALFAVFSTPPSDKAAFTSAIQGTWNYIYSEWFPKSGYEFDGMKCDYEFYDERCMGEKGNVCDICIPVVKKET
jgi:AraC family transcriptional regulator